MENMRAWLFAAAFVSIPITAGAYLVRPTRIVDITVTAVNDSCRDTPGSECISDFPTIVTDAHGYRYEIRNEKVAAQLHTGSTRTVLAEGEPGDLRIGRIYEVR